MDESLKANKNVLAKVAQTKLNQQLDIARTYQEHGATCISVLTDVPYFQGHLSYLARIRASVAIPLLRKDFLIAEYQVVGCSKVLRQLARLAGDRPGKARELRLDDLQAWIPRLAKLPPSRRAELPGISRVRAHQALAGAIVAESLMRVTGGRVVICPWSTRDGLLLTLADHAGTPRAQRFRAA